MKTDRRDARALAEACLLGAYRPAYRLSDAQRHVRARLTDRDTLVRTRTRYSSLVHALLRQRGWPVPSGSAEGFPRRAIALPLPGRWRSEVALARRLAGILCALLRDGTVYAQARRQPRDMPEEVLT